MQLCELWIFYDFLVSLVTHGHDFSGTTYKKDNILKPQGQKPLKLRIHLLTICQNKKFRKIVTFSMKLNFFRFFKILYIVVLEENPTTFTKKTSNWKNHSTAFFPQFLNKLILTRNPKNFEAPEAFETTYPLAVRINSF